METNDIEKARAKREFESFCRKAGINKGMNQKAQMEAMAAACKNQAKCCDGKCKGHSSDNT